MKRLYFAMMTAVVAVAAFAAPRTGPWTKEQAWEWYNAQPWIRGCNYMPASSPNRYDMWQVWDSERRFEEMDRELALAEEPELMAERETIWEELLDMTIGGEDANRSRCIMEIHAGTGGDEASLFARDLYGMYRKYCESKNWKLETMSMSETEVGGFKEIVFGVDGEGCYRELQFESGGHRVQRVPKTETQGRIHTSAASVAVLAEPEEVEIDLKPEDYEIDRFCASGPGGQHVNKTSSAIRLTHKETGLVVSCQDERSQFRNRERAMKILRSRIYESMLAEQNAKIASDRRLQVGTGDRSERIRTYNFPQGRVTDHRIGLTLYKIQQIMDGDLDELIDALITTDQAEKLKAGAEE